MKKTGARKCGLLAVLLAAALLTPLLPAAEAAGGKPVELYVNGDLLNIPPSFGAPFYDGSGRLQIPMRYIVQSCGYEVVWNSARQTATIPTKGGDIVITLGSQTMTTPQGGVTMDTSAMARDGRTYIPLRFALEALGFEVAWTGGAAADTVHITGQIGAGSGRVPMTAAEVAEMASPATFYIEVMGADKKPFASGSGFFIDPSGVGVTNYHVIEGARYATITTVDGAVYSMGMVLYYDIERDLAVFNAQSAAGGALNVPYLSLASPSSIRNGDVVYAIGSPLGLQNSITDGLVSNKDRVFPGETMTYIQTSAPISHGNSGGPLLNQYGEVVGVNTSGLESGQNLNFAIPVSALTAVDYSAQSNWRTLSQVAEQETLAAPVNLRVVRMEGDVAYIQWDPVSGADYYHFYEQEQEQGEESFWYSEDEQYPGEPKRYAHDSDYSVKFYRLENGRTYSVIVTAVKGGAESPDSQVLTFTFQSGSTGTDQIPCYAELNWLPDFGALYGLTPTYHNNNGESVIFYYRVPQFSYIEGYMDLLRSQGFAYDAERSKGFNGTAPMLFHNSALGKMVLCDLDGDTGEFIIFALLD